MAPHDLRSLARKLGAALGADLPEVPGVLGLGGHWLAGSRVAPGQSAPLVIGPAAPGAPPRLTLARFGMAVPRLKRLRSHARIESVPRLPACREALPARRALVPLIGYYLWLGPVGERWPVLCRAADGALVLALALFAEELDAQTGEFCTAFTVITTASPEPGEPARPALLGLDDPRRHRWLDAETAPPREPELLRAFVEPAGLRLAREPLRRAGVGRPSIRLPRRSGSSAGEPRRRPVQLELFAPRA